jgi:hypothetical protein
MKGSLCDARLRLTLVPKFQSRNAGFLKAHDKIKPRLSDKIGYWPN